MKQNWGTIKTVANVNARLAMKGSEGRGLHLIDEEAELVMSLASLGLEVARKHWSKV